MLRCLRSALSSHVFAQFFWSIAQQTETNQTNKQPTGAIQVSIRLSPFSQIMLNGLLYPSRYDLCALPSSA
jgi:hypothetical protein